MSIATAPSAQQQHPQHQHQHPVFSDEDNLFVSVPGAVEGLWEYYNLDITVDRLVAGIPANPKLMQAWLEVNEAPDAAKNDQQTNLAAREQLDPEKTHGVVFFMMPDPDDRSALIPAYETRCMKAAFKEASNILKEMLDIKAFRSKLTERLFVGPKVVPIRSAIKTEERPISVMTPQGPRTSIKRFDYAENVALSFKIKIMTDKLLTIPRLNTLLEYMSTNGIGSDRSQGAGMFTVRSFRKDSVGGW